MTLATSGVLMCLSGMMLGGYRDTLYFHPTKDHVPSEIGIPFEDVYLQDKTFVVHLWAVIRRGAKKNLIFSHGNAGNLSHRVHVLQFMYRDLPDYNLFFYDYPGFGRSESSKKPNITDCLKSLDHVVKYVESQTGLPIVMYGESIGTGIVTEYLVKSGRRFPCILQSAFTSIADLMPTMFGGWMGSLAYYMVGNDLNNLRNLQILHQRSQTVVLLHSPTDEMIPFEHFLQMTPFATAAYEIEGDHNNTDYNQVVVDAIIEAV